MIMTMIIYEFATVNSNVFKSTSLYYCQQVDTTLLVTAVLIIVTTLLGY